MVRLSAHGVVPQGYVLMLLSALFTAAAIQPHVVQAFDYVIMAFQAMSVLLAVFLCVRAAIGRSSAADRKRFDRRFIIHVLLSAAMFCALVLPDLSGSSFDRVAMVTTMLLVVSASLSVLWQDDAAALSKSIDSFETTPGLAYQNWLKNAGLQTVMPEQQREGVQALDHSAEDDAIVATFGRDSTVLDGDTLGIKRIEVTKKALDKLTGVLSFETLCAVADQAIAQTKRYGRPHSAIMLRYDDFDSVCAELGKPTAQRAVKLLAVTSKRELRDSDAVGRISPNVFVGLLPETDVHGATSALHRVCTALAQRTVPTAVGMQSLKVSVSSTSLRDVDDDFDVVLQRLTGNLSVDLPPLPAPKAKLPGKLD